MEDWERGRGASLGLNSYAGVHLYYNLGIEGKSMGESGKRWTVNDRDSNPIYLTEEQWKHITDPDNHPEMADYESQLKVTVQKGHRRQEPLNPRKYRYTHQFDELPEDFNHIVAIALFGFDVDDEGETIANNFIATAFMKHVRAKGDEE
ncbi:MAG TPA: hypothetical protein VJ020_13570 [Anaerolineales bacterium]|nr:hypothetical protein [Anaerolineales bacterium]